MLRDMSVLNGFCPSLNLAYTIPNLGYLPAPRRNTLAPNIPASSPYLATNTLTKNLLDQITTSSTTSLTMQD